MKHRLAGPVAWAIARFVLAAALLAMPAAAGDEKAAPAPPAKQKQKQTQKNEGPAKPAACAPSQAEEPVVITNEDLERMFGPGETPEARPEAEPDDRAAHDHGEEPSPPQAPPNPLQAMEQDKADEARRQQAIADAQRDVDAAEAAVRDLEKRLLEQRNPYLPRPELSKEEAAAQQGMNGAERVARTQEQLDLVRKELERAKAQLDRLRSGG